MPRHSEIEDACPAGNRDLIKLEPADVLAAETAGKLLEPMIKPLPPFPDPMSEPV